MSGWRGSLLIIRPVVDNIVFLQIVRDLAGEMGAVALAVEKRTLEEARSKKRASKRASPVGKQKKRSKG